MTVNQIVLLAAAYLIANSVRITWGETSSYEFRPASIVMAILLLLAIK